MILGLFMGNDRMRPKMRLALAQINTFMGNIPRNVERICASLQRAKEAKIDLVIFPELSICGYPPQDLLDRFGFLIQANEALEKLIRDFPDQDFLIGQVMKNPGIGNPCFNSAVLVESGKIKAVRHKTLLPTYDVFDEHRYFEQGVENRCVEYRGQKLGILICEDIWSQESIYGRIRYRRDPARELAKDGATLFITISASPFQEGKDETRFKIAEKIVQDTKVPMAFLNLVGGNDELIFDGGSFFMNENAKVTAKAKVFEEDFLELDLSQKESRKEDWPKNEMEWIRKALVLGLRDYVQKCGFSKVLLGLSGGIDSSLVALLAVEALGKKNVLGVSMPSPFTSEASIQDARLLADRLGIRLIEIPIRPIMDSFHFALEESFQGFARDVTEENIQARIRGNLLMALSNKYGSLLLTTGNKSELAVGYCTQYGDMAGGLAVISDLPKTEVYKLAAYLNRPQEQIPLRILQRPPSAELRDHQTDQDSLPPYDLLDQILELYVEKHIEASDIIGKGFDPKIVQKTIAMIDRSEFKRKQSAPGLRVTSKAFGVGRRMPIARGRL